MNEASENDHWCAAAAHAGSQVGVDVHCLHIGGAIGTEGTPISPPMAGASTLTLDAPIEQIVAEAAGRAVLDGHIPAVTAHERYATFKSMSLRQLQPLSRGLITDAALEKTRADLAGVRCHRVRVDADVFRRNFRTAFDISPDGASLIRPDVTWRGDRGSFRRTPLASSRRR